MLLGHEPWITVPGTCCNGPLTISQCIVCYQSVGMFYQTVDYELLGQCPCGSVLCTMCYWTMDNALLCPGTYCTRQLAMWYNSVYYVLLGHGHFIQGCELWITRPLIMWNRTLYYVLLSCRHILPSCGPCDTTPLTILYYAIGHIVHSCVTCAIRLLIHSTWMWTMLYWVLDYMLLAHWPCGSWPYTMYS